MSAWSQLEQLLTCAICLDRFRNPKLLPCQHTFCGEPCMEGLVDYARRQIKCPECRAEHRIPYNGVQSFPNNVTLARFLDLHRGITGEEPEPLPSQMDRCGVCGEKAFCLRCAHCDKKVCEECRTAHLDILRREINRMNTQVRRGLVKLTEQAQQTGKSSEKLAVMSSQIRDEITESVRRFIKDLKDKETKLLADLDEFTLSESKNSEKLNDDLDLELATISSNCELVEEHVTEQDEWTDVELMEYKDIFLKTLEFLRNLDPDTMDLSRKIKYIQKVDLDTLRRNAADFGEIKITAPAASLLTSGLLSPSDSSSNLVVPGSNLIRSQSDHRLAAQFASSGRTTKDALQRSYLDVTGGNRYGSDSDRERGSSPPGRRGERFGSVRSYGARGSELSYTRGWERPGDSEYEPSNSSNFRSRFMRERIRERGGGEDHSFEEHDSDLTSSHRVRFQEEAGASQARTKLFDTEEMANLRAPLSGIIKLADSPHVMERLHQNEMKAKQKEAEAKENGTINTTTTPFVPPPTQPIQPRPTRQISEDEIEKQKKQNKAEAAQQASQPANSTNTIVAPQGQTPKSNPVPKTGSLAVESTAQSGRSNTSPSASVANRRVQALQKEDTRSTRSNSSDDGVNSGPESGDVTCDDDTPSATSAAASALNSVSRRRIYASSHSTSGGGAGTGSLANSMSASVDHASDTGRSKPSSATNRLLHATVGPDISITSDEEQQHTSTGAILGDSFAEPIELPRLISSLPSPSPTPSQASETSDTTAETTSEATNETDTETEITTEVTTAALPPHSALPPLSFQSYAANENTILPSASPAPSEDTASEEEESSDDTEDESVTTSASSSASVSQVLPPHSQSPISESTESSSVSPLPTTSTATLTIPIVTVKGPGGVDVEIVKKTSNVTIMRRATSKDSDSSSIESDSDDEEEEEESDDEATIQNASNANIMSHDNEPKLEPLPESSDTNNNESNNTTNDSKYENRDVISDAEVEDEAEDEEESDHEEVDHDRLDPVENVENISQWHTNELNGESRLPPLDFNNNSHKVDERESSDEISDEEDEEEVEDEMVDAEEGRDFEEDEFNLPEGVNENGSDDNNYYQSSYYGSNPPSARSSLSRFGTDEPTSAGSTSYYSKQRNRKYSRDDDAGLGDTTAIVPSSPSYYNSSYTGAARRASLSRTSTLEDEDDDVPSSGVRSYYSTARKQFQAQQAALAAMNAQTNDTTRYGSSGSTGGSSSYFRNRLAKSRSSHAIAAYDDSDDDSPVNANAINPLSPSSGSYRSRFGFGASSNAAAAVAPDTSEQFASSASAGRRTSRSGYTYRTRILSREPSPEEEAAGSVTQYLINKYGTRSGTSRPSMLSKSKSSHVIYGRSLSSSDEDNVTSAATAATAVPISPYRRTSRDSESSYKSTATPSYGLTYPRQIYQQKRRMLMKIGSRGTNPSCFTWPRGVACAPDNSIVVADSSNHRVQVFDFSGRFQFEFGSYGSGEGEFDCLAGVAVNRMGHFIVSDRYNHRVQVFDGTGRFLRAFGSEGRSDGKFSYPWGVSCDALGFIYLCDKENHRIQVFQSDGTFVGKFGSIGSRSGMLEHPHYIAVSNTNRIIVSDSNNHRVQIFDVNGRSMSTFGSEGSADGQFKFPRGVAVDENGFIIVGDSGNNRIQIFNPDGTFLKSFGSWGSGESEFKGLEGVAIDSNSRILVCDRENHRIQIF